LAALSQTVARHWLFPAILGAAVLPAAPLATRAQTKSLPDPIAALAELEKLQERHEQTIESQRREAIALLRPAVQNSASATRLYEDAVENQGQPDMADWRKKNADLLRAKPFEASLQLRLRYLLLSLERGRAPEAAARWAAPSLQYAADLARLLTDKSFSAEPKEAREMLQAPLGEGPFVRWLRLDPLLPPGDLWEQSPGDLGGILEKNVRTPWRKDGDPRLDESWRLELSAGAALAESRVGRGGRSIDDFNNFTAPSLLFRRARDRAAAGQPHRATADLLDLARRHPAHPEFPAWAAALREMLGDKTDTPLGAAKPPED